jgi:hypothetical protein
VCSKLSQQTTHHVKLGRVVDSLLLSRKSLSTATQFLTAQGYQIYKKSGYKLSFFGEPCKHSRRKGTKQLRKNNFLKPHHHGHNRLRLLSAAARPFLPSPPSRASWRIFMKSFRLILQRNQYANEIRRRSHGRPAAAVPAKQVAAAAARKSRIDTKSVQSEKQSKDEGDRVGKED